MTYYPHEAGEAERFVPSAFADMENPPTFWLRWGTPREKRAFRRMLDLAGLRTYDQAQQRDEILKGMKTLLGETDFAAWEPRVRAYWQAIDEHNREVAEMQKAEPGITADDLPTFAFEGEDAIVLTLEQIARDWMPYRRMIADSREAGRESPALISAVIIERFENLDVAVEHDENVRKYLSQDCVAVIADRMDAMAREQGLDPNALKPSADLHSQTMIRLFMDKDWEKNSSSPSPSEPAPTLSANGKASRAGKSKASATSTATPAA